MKYIFAATLVAVLARLEYDISEFRKAGKLLAEGTKMLSDVAQIHDDYIKVLNRHVALMSPGIVEELQAVEEKWEFTSIVEEWGKRFD